MECSRFLFFPCIRYRIYRNGKLEREVENVGNEWPKDGVAFLIGCSFTCDGALLDAGIRLKSAERNLNVPMYNTNIQCQSAGEFNSIDSAFPFTLMLLPDAFVCMKNNPQYMAKLVYFKIMLLCFYLILFSLACFEYFCFCRCYRREIIGEYGSFHETYQGSGHD